MSSKSKKRRSDSSSSSSSSSESDASNSSRDCKRKKRTEMSSDSETDKKSKVRKEHTKNSDGKDGSKHERPDKYKRDHRDYKTAGYKSHRENDFRSSSKRGDDDKYRRSHEHDDRRRNDNRSDDRRRDDARRDRSGRNERERERNDSGGRRRSPGRFRKRSRSRSKSFDHANAKWGKDSKEEPKGEKQKANFGLSGKLTEETNTYKGVVVKYSEPPEARKPKRRWRLYPFKGEKALQTLFIHRESAYLVGRDRKVVDLPVDHPSCSKQHAALQYRLVPFTRDDGSAGKRVRLYIIDLESANGTFINNKKIEPKKYVELLEKDVIKFGFSSREYVLLHENSKDEAQDDDVKMEEEEIKVKKEEQVS